MSRKKRLTPHWRTFIRPLVWRCKWVELQIKKFQSQASEYDRELAKYDQRKKTELESCVLEGFGAKSLPFLSRSQRKEVMKRRKRKRVEDTGDMVGFMSRHKLFSYFGMHNRCFPWILIPALTYFLLLPVMTYTSCTFQKIRDLPPMLLLWMMFWGIKVRSENFFSM